MIFCTKLYWLKVFYKACKLLDCWLLILIGIAMKSSVFQTPNFVATNPFVLSSLTLRRLLSQILNKIKEEATRCKRSDEKVDQKNKTVMNSSNVSERIPKNCNARVYDLMLHYREPQCAQGTMLKCC